MTCIVGIVNNDNVYIGGDSLGSSTYNKSVRKDAKVFRKGKFLIGFTSSYRMGQLMMSDAFNLRKQNDNEDEFMYMINAFIPALQKLFDKGGFGRQESGEKSGGTFLIGYKNRLFKIQDDYQVSETIDNYDACGSGQDFALGALAVINNKISPEEKIKLALETAEKFSPSVGRPFIIKTL